MNRVEEFYNKEKSLHEKIKQHVKNTMGPECWKTIKQYDDDICGSLRYCSVNNMELNETLYLNKLITKQYLEKYLTKQLQKGINIKDIVILVDINNYHLNVFTINWKVKFVFYSLFLCI